MRILVTGASGLLGSNLCLQWSEDNSVIGAYHNVPITLTRGSAVQFDLCDQGKVSEVMSLHQPDIVVHCAALANVDACEKDPELAKEVNVLGTENIARACGSVGAKMVFISTDSVFDGSKGMYKEEDDVNPLNVYAGTKVEAEQKVSSICSDHIIIRTALYGWNAQDKLSLAEWMLDKFKRGEEIPAFEDARFSPIEVNDMGDVVLKLCEGGFNGIAHVGSHSPLSKFDFARTVAEVFGLDAGKIIPTKISDGGLGAPRPGDVSLNVSKVETAIRAFLPNAKDGLIRMRNLEESGFKDNLKKMCESLVSSTV